MLSPRWTSRGPLARLVARVLIVTLVLGLLPPPPAQASLSAIERPLPALPLAESVPSPFLAVVAVAVCGAVEAAPRAVAFALADPHWPSKYHRARWMDPRAGRFAGMDPFEGLEREPVTLHRYLYAAADPANRIDPTGELVDGGLAGSLTSFTAQTTLRATSTVSYKLIASVILGTAAVGGVLGPIGVLEEIRRRGVPTDLYAFGNTTAPRGPRPSDFNLPDDSGTVGPETPPLPRGASTFGDPNAAPLTGHYHRIPRGILVPLGLAVIADGPEVAGSTNPATHHTIYPVVAMPFQSFVQKFFELPWVYAGKK